MSEKMFEGSADFSEIYDAFTKLNSTLNTSRETTRKYTSAMNELGDLETKVTRITKLRNDAGETVTRTLVKEVDGTEKLTIVTRDNSDVLARNTERKNANAIASKRARDAQKELSDGFKAALAERVNQDKRLADLNKRINAEMLAQDVRAPKSSDATWAESRNYEAQLAKFKNAAMKVSPETAKRVMAAVDSGTDAAFAGNAGRFAAAYINLAKAEDQLGASSRALAADKRKELEAEVALYHQNLQSEKARRAVIQNQWSRRGLARDATSTLQNNLGALPSDVSPEKVASYSRALSNFREVVKNSGASAAQIQDIYNKLSTGMVTAFTKPQQQIANAMQAVIAQHQNMEAKAKESVQRVTVSWGSFFRLFTVQILHRTLATLTTEFQMSIEKAVEFEQRIGEIRTIGQAAPQDFDKWSESIRNLSNAYGFLLGDVAESTYQTISNQIAQGAEATRYLAEEAKFALAAVTSLTNAENLTSSVLNSYSLSVEQAYEVNAKLFRTIDLGRVRADDLANTFGRVGPMARSLGVSLDELLSSIAAITIQGVLPEESLTALRNIMLKLIRPTDEMKGYFKELGVTSAEEAIAVFGLTGMLDKLAESTKGSSTELGELFGRMRAINGMMMLSGSGLEKFRADYAEISRNAFGPYNAAIQEMRENTGRLYKIELNKIRNFFTITLGREAMQGFVGLTTSTNLFYTTIRGGGTVLITFAGTVVILRGAIAALTSQYNMFALAALRAHPIITAIGVAISALATAWTASRVAQEKYLADQQQVNQQSLEAYQEAMAKQSTSMEEALTYRLRLQLKYISEVRASNDKLIDNLENRNDDLAKSFKGAFDDLQSELNGIVKALEKDFEDLKRAVETLSTSWNDLSLKKEMGISDRAIDFMKPFQQVDALLARAQELREVGMGIFLSEDGVESKYGKDLLGGAEQSLQRAYDIAKSQFEEASKNLENNKFKGNRANEQRRLMAASQSLFVLEREIVDTQDRQLELIRAKTEASRVARDEAELEAAAVTNHMNAMIKQNQIMLDIQEKLKNDKDMTPEQRANLTVAAKVAKDQMLGEAADLRMMGIDVNPEVPLYLSKIEEYTANIVTLVDLAKRQEQLNSASQNLQDVKTAAQTAAQGYKESALRDRAKITELMPEIMKKSGTAQEYLLGGKKDRLQELLEMANANPEKLNRDMWLEMRGMIQVARDAAAILPGKGASRDTEELNKMLSGLDSVYKLSQNASISEAALNTMNQALGAVPPTLQAVGTQATSLAEQLQNAKNLVAQLSATPQVPVPTNTGQIFGPVLPPKGFAFGGLTRGTDTIPAMLSPGEFVVNRRSTGRFLTQLIAMNSGHAPTVPSRGGDTWNLNVNVKGGDSARSTAREIVTEIKRGIRRRTWSVPNN